MKKTYSDFKYRKTAGKDYRYLLKALKVFGIDISPLHSKKVSIYWFLVRIIVPLLHHIFLLERLLTFLPIIIAFPGKAKLFFAFIAHSFANVCLWNCVNYRRKQIRYILFKTFNSINSFSGRKYRKNRCLFEKFICASLIVLCVLPIAYGFGELITLSMFTDLRLYLWRVDISAMDVKLILFIRGFLLSAQRDTFCGIFCLLYSLICWKTKQALLQYRVTLETSLNSFKLERIQKHTFINYNALLDAIQDTDDCFSQPIFVLTINLVLSLFSLLPITLSGDRSIPPFAMLHIAVTLITSATYLTFIIVMAAQIPLEMNRNILLFHKLHEVIIQYPTNFNLNSCEISFLKIIMKRESITLSGCHIIYLNRGLILTLVGSLITYGLLIVNFK